MRNMLRQKETRADAGFAVSLCTNEAFCLRSSWAAIHATAAPSSAEGTEASKLFSMESSVWQCAHSARWAAAFGSAELLSVICSSTSSGRHSSVAEAAACHIFRLFLLSAMVNLPQTPDANF